MKLTF